MMRKSLALAIVFSVFFLVNVAGAADEFIFALNGEPQPAEVTLEPSDTIELDLELADGQDISSYLLEYDLSDPSAEFLWDGTTFPTTMDLPGKTQNETPQNLEITQSQIFSPAVEGPTVLMQGLLVHCLEAGPDLTMSVNVSGSTTIDGSDLTVGETLHTLTIHQVPEPATIGLLGLGGLFLVRRRKK